MKNEPFIHLFEAIGKNYMYDVNTNKILEIPLTVYKYLRGDELLDSHKEEEYLELLKRQGFLKTNRVTVTEHPDTPYLKYYLSNKIGRVTLQVTQNCNLRCEYCVYSGSYVNRQHSNKRMSWEMAKQSIDFLLNHSRETSYLAVGFYGGEPLLEFDLIKKCILYASYNAEGKMLFFNITTNATLLTEEIIEFFIKHNVYMVISLDGPKEFHDQYRKFNHSGEGTYDVVMKKIELLSEKYPTYYEKNVRYNTVLNTDRSFECVSDFVSCEKLIEKNTFSSSTITQEYSKQKSYKSEEMERYYAEYNFEEFKRLLKVSGIYRGEKLSKLLGINDYLEKEFRDNMKMSQRLSLPSKSHHSGPCIPGAIGLFINVDGNFYPCEKVSEACTIARMGHIHSGIDVEKVKKILNIEKCMEERCHNCWAYTHCTMCLVQMEAIEDLTEEVATRKCALIKMNLEEKFKNYCMLSEIEKNKPRLFTAQPCEWLKAT